MAGTAYTSVELFTMRLRLLIGSLVTATLLTLVGSLAAPASAEPQRFGTCKITALSADDGDEGLTVPERSDIIECYY